jgi:hypothetical protein
MCKASGFVGEAAAAASTRLKVSLKVDECLAAGAFR